MTKAWHMLIATALLPLVCCAFVLSAPAHTLPISFLTAVPGERYLHLELTLNPFELNFFSELDLNRDGRLDPAEIEAQEGIITGRLLETIKVRANGVVTPAEVAGLMPEMDDHHLTLRAHYPVRAADATVSIESSLTGVTSSSHLTQVTYGRAGQTQAARLDAQSGEAVFDPMETPRATSAETLESAALVHSNRAWLLLGLPATAVFLVLLLLIVRHKQVSGEANERTLSAHI